MIDTRFTVELPSNLLDKIISDNSLMIEVQQLFAETIDPWTPFLTGQLSGDITVDKYGVTYNVPYSAEKYYGTVYNKTVHPLATSHWDEVAMQSEMETFKKKVGEIIERYAN